MSAPTRKRAVSLDPVRLYPLNRYCTTGLNQQQEHSERPDLVILSLNPPETFQKYELRPQSRPRSPRSHEPRCSGRLSQGPKSHLGKIFIPDADCHVRKCPERSMAKSTCEAGARLDRPPAHHGHIAAAQEAEQVVLPRTGQSAPSGKTTAGRKNQAGRFILLPETVRPLPWSGRAPERRRARAASTGFPCS